MVRFRFRVRVRVRAGDGVHMTVHGIQDEGQASVNELTDKGQDSG